MAIMVAEIAFPIWLLVKGVRIASASSDQVIEAD
jgi:hypothetical protein